MVHLPTNPLLLTFTLLLTSPLTAAESPKKHPNSANDNNVSIHRSPTTTTSSTNTLKLARSLPLSESSPNQKRQSCTGTCAACFGTGYTLCPGSSITCYLPGDSLYGEDSCPYSSSGSGTGTTASGSIPTSTGSAGDSDTCTGKGATCVSCFGDGYEPCGDGRNCFNPDDPRYDTCPTGTSSGSDSTSSPSSADGPTTTSSCAELHGPGNIPCAPDGCYNPDAGEVCCADGYYCDKGETCSSQVGKCCTSSSTSAGCLAGGSLGGSGGSSSNSGTSSFSSIATGTRVAGTETSTPTTFANSGSSGGTVSGAAAAGSGLHGQVVMVLSGLMVVFGGILVVL